MTGSALTRRGFLAGGAVLAGVAGVAGTAALVTGQEGEPVATPTVPTTPTGAPTTLIAFDGEHQPGIADPAPLLTTFLGMDLVDRSRDGLDAVLRLVSDDARRLMAGLPALADTEPFNAAEPGGLTIGIGLGRTAFEAAGLPVPPALAELPPFEGDDLQQRWGQTDLVIQVGSDSPMALEHALGMITKDTAGIAAARWAQAGFRGSPAGTASRNLMGQVDGTSNPRSVDELDAHVWIDEGPLTGGTVLVLRRIRMALDTWSMLDDPAKELAVGRRLESGAPLNGTSQTDPVDLTALDERGLPMIPRSAHVAVALRSGGRMLRRPFNYVEQRGDGSRESGLVFAAYMRDPAGSFTPMQEAMSREDALHRWLTAIGSATYAFPRGSRPDGFVGEELLA